MPKVIHEDKYPVYNAEQNMNIFKKRFIVERASYIPSAYDEDTYWRYWGTYSRLSAAKKYMATVQGKVRIIEVGAGEIYREGWSTSEK